MIRESQGHRLPDADIPVALLLYNVGVELGELLFVALLMRLAWLARKTFELAPSGRMIGYGIGSISAFWMTERIVQIVRWPG